VNHLKDTFTVSERRAARVVGVSRSTLRYRSRLSEGEPRLLARMDALVKKHPRYGYRRITKSLRANLSLAAPHALHLSPASRHPSWGRGSFCFPVPRTWFPVPRWRNSHRRSVRPKSLPIPRRDPAKHPPAPDPLRVAHEPGGGAESAAGLCDAPDLFFWEFLSPKLVEQFSGCYLSCPRISPKG
jgi:hypothetical protein